MDVQLPIVSVLCSLESSMVTVKSSLQQAKDQLQEKEVAYSLLQEQFAQVCKYTVYACMYIVCESHYTYVSMYAFTCICTVCIMYTS